MSIKLTYTRAEVQELLDKIKKGDFDNAKTLEGHPASYFVVASEFTSLAGSFATEQGRVNTLYSYFNNGSANDALSLGGQVPAYYATASTLNTLSQTVSDFKSLFDSMFEVVDGNIHAKLALWSSGGITAGGVGNGGSGGGGISYNRLDSWADYSADKSGWVLSALLGNDLNNRLTSVENAGYVTASTLAPYALRSEIPSLVGYATESFVTSQGYITASALGGYATQSWVESKNYLTGITSAMVTTVLGYTPYNSANFTKANIKSTLGISDWALASAKPTYTASEVGAVIVSNDFYSASLNDFIKAGIYRFNTPADTAEGMTLYGNLFVIRGGTNDTLSQLYFNYDGAGRIFVRSGNLKNYTSRSWKTLAFTSDIPTKLSQLTDDVVAGKYLLLSGGTLSGSNRDLLRLNTSNTSGPRIRLYENGNLIAQIGCVPKQTTTDYGAYFVNVSSSFGVILGNDKKAYITINTDTMSKDYQILHSGNYSDYALSKNGGTVNGSITANSFIGNLTGNADSATKLATPRTIWGQSFDGMQDITGALTSSSIIKASSFFSTSISIECGANGVVDPITYGGEINRFSSNLYLQNRSGNIYLSHASGTTYIRGKLKGVGATFTDTLTAPSLTIGGVTITYDSANEALCINGNMYALGGITAGGAGISAYSSLEARVARLEQQLNIS